MPIGTINPTVLNRFSEVLRRDPDVRLEQQEDIPAPRREVFHPYAGEDFIVICEVQTHTPAGLTRLTAIAMKLDNACAMNRVSNTICRVISAGQATRNLRIS